VPAAPDGRRLNDYELPRGWLPVAAVNPSDGEYEVSELDPALLSRFVRAEVVPDREQWLAWARQVRLHPDVITYVATDKSVFENSESNPRAWTYVSALLSAPENASTPQTTLRVAVSGLVGLKRQASFMRFLKEKVGPLDAEAVLADYSRYRERVKGWIADKGRLDLVKGTVWAVMTELQSQHLFNATKGDRKRWQNLGRFLSDLPGDLREEAEAFFADHNYAIPGTRRVR
jgi:hypothetical protein